MGRGKEKGIQEPSNIMVLLVSLFYHFLPTNGDLSLPGKKKSKIRVLIPFHTNDGSNGMEQLFRLINKSGTCGRKSGGSTGFQLGIVGTGAEVVSECVIVECPECQPKEP